jgi:hypothetical protein
MPINEIHQILKNLSRDKPWLTAGGIARCLSTPHNETEVQKRLLADYHAGNREVRYSALPHKGTLKVLWGHRENVGDRKLYNLTKDNAADQFFCDVGQHWKRCFISHSHRDVNRVVEIGELLIQSEIYPWLAETELAKDESIHETIIDGLKEASYFLLFLTRNALRSGWTQKESGWTQKEFMEADVKAKFTSGQRGLVFDSTDTSLLNFFQSWSPSNTGVRLHDEHWWNQRCEDFICYLNSYLREEPQLYFYPDIPHRLVQNGETHLQIKPLEAFIEKLKTESEDNS